MPNVNKVTVMGVLGRDPETAYRLVMLISACRSGGNV